MLSHIQVTHIAFIGGNTSEVCSRRRVRKVFLINSNDFVGDEGVTNSIDDVPA